MDIKAVLMDAARLSVVKTPSGSKFKQLGADTGTDRLL